MTEINPNTGVSIQPSVAPKETKQADNTAIPNPSPEPAKEMTQKDLGNVPAASIGQSQVQVKAADSLENDLKNLNESPELVKKSMEIGEAAEKDKLAKGEDPAKAYFTGVNVSKAFIDEFAK